MCGIAGLIDLKAHRVADEAAVRRMLAAMSHRGPDGSDVVSSPGMCMGAVRLAIVDREGGQQPFTLPEHGITVVFNGEIDNFRELRAELEALGTTFTTDSDTEVVAQSFVTWGQGFDLRFRGMYALAIHRMPGSFVLARDDHGEKPLYTSELPDGWLAFASEFAALSPLIREHASANVTAIAQVLTFGFPIAEETLFRGVKQVHPRSEERRDGPRSSHEGSSNLRGEELIDELHERLRIAVARCLKPGVPAGVFLSGGVDSAIIAGIAKEVAGSDIPVFSAGFADPRFDESSDAAAVAQHLGLTHHVERIDTVTPDDVRRVALSHGEAFADPSSLALRKLCEFAAPHLRIALGGDGGDELFGGYDRHRAYLLAHAIHARCPEFVARANARILAFCMRLAGKRERAERFLMCAKAFQDGEGDPYSELLSISSQADRQALLGPTAQHLASCAAAIPILRSSRNAPPKPAFSSARTLDLELYLANDLCTKSDRQSMSQSIELRSPFLDRGVVDLAMGVPDAEHLSWWKSKKLLRKLAERYMPSHLWNRRKKGFGVPLADWLRGPLRSMAEALKTSDALVAKAHLNRTAICQLVDDHLANRRDTSRLLYALIMIDLALTRDAEPVDGIRPT